MRGVVYIFFVHMVFVFFVKFNIGSYIRYIYSVSYSHKNMKGNEKRR